MLAMPLIQQDSQATILDMVANAVESLGRCHLEGIYFDGRWQDVQVPGRGAAAKGPPRTAVITTVLLPSGGEMCVWRSVLLDGALCRESEFCSLTMS